MLKNGDIAVGYISRRYSRYCAYIVILHDDYDATPEITIAAKPYTLYPNPVKHQLSLRFDDGTEPESVEIHDVAGRLVATKRNVMEHFDMSAMPSGVYMMRITLKDGTSYHERILKE